MTSIGAATARELAEAWLLADPDVTTRLETHGILESGDPEELEACFGNHLEFGTAGLRGPLRTGPNGMNRLLVRQVAGALVDAIIAGEFGAGEPHLVVGYDARHGSTDFAYDTARIALGRGVRCSLLPEPLPTPVLAFAVRHLEASAGVMVTASHNPRADNGYKVYGPDGALIASPLDAAVSNRMLALPLQPESALAKTGDDAQSPASLAVVDRYLDLVTAPHRSTSVRDLRIAYTPLHGVGGGVMTRALAAAGFSSIATVASQAAPDPNFPTAAFPNPEEPGALDELLALGQAISADIAIANDPDADRLAVAVPTRDGWRLLGGDEVGCLLADYLLQAPAPDTRAALVVNTVTSSSLLGRIADHHGAIHKQTLTGFKWVMAARAAHPEHRLVCGYEEALGYAVNDRIRDKDGISAALAIASLAADLKGRGESLLDRLHQLHDRHGVVTNGQRPIRLEHASAQDLVMDGLRAHPPAKLGGDRVDAVHDLRSGFGDLPPTNGLMFETGDARVTIRPSGTEPKLKVYGEVAPRNPMSEAAARVRLRDVVADAVEIACSFDLPAPGPPEGGRPETPSGAEVAALFKEGAAAPSDDDLRLVVRATDLTTLEGDDTRARVRALCAAARRPDVADASVGPVAAVCVYPVYVALARQLLDGTPVRVATVAAGFPHGLSPLSSRLAEIEAAVKAGADEIDIVIDRAAVLEGRLGSVRDELEAFREIAGTTCLKVIIETGELGTAENVRTATQLAIEAGADFVKTSTGKARTNATPLAVAVMADVIARSIGDGHRPVGLKIAGGVRTAADACGYLAIVREYLGPEWMTPDRLRFGASSLLIDLLSTREQPDR